ncbi:uncharacterized protein LOC118433034 [Folsomia candida]|uniref:uncharacterized protein LOC118433034 n=1 Tax=Folsomia candida TaxID=158441 RepID=UPI001604A4B8|nr:uncharacterized protein LOC118433034 [Folsomia candida]
MSTICCCGCCTVQVMTNLIAGISTVYKSSVWVNFMIKHPDDVLIPYFHEYRGWYIALVSIPLIMGLVNFITASLLVQGCRLRNYRLILPWLVWSYVSIFLLTIGILIICTITIIAEEELFSGLCILAVGIIFLGVQIYCVFMVKKFVHILKRDAAVDFNENCRL